MGLLSTHRCYHSHLTTDKLFQHLTAATFPTQAPAAFANIKAYLADSHCDLLGNMEPLREESPRSFLFHFKERRPGPKLALTFRSPTFAIGQMQCTEVADGSDIKIDFRMPVRFRLAVLLPTLIAAALQIAALFLPSSGYLADSLRYLAITLTIPVAFIAFFHLSVFGAMEVLKAALDGQLEGAA